MDWGGESDHCPIVLELRGGTQRPPSPFKFNAAWVADSTYVDLLKATWRPLGLGGRKGPARHL